MCFWWRLNFILFLFGLLIFRKIWHNVRLLDLDRLIILFLRDLTLPWWGVLGWLLDFLSNHFILDYALIEFLDLDRLFALFSVLSLWLDEGLDALILGWRGEPKGSRGICLHHLLDVIIIIFGRLGCERHELFLFWDFEIFIVQAIKVIENAFNRLLKVCWGRDCFGHCLWALCLDHRKLCGFCNISFLYTWLIHSSFKHFPGILILFWKFGKSFLFDLYLRLW